MPTLALTTLAGFLLGAFFFVGLWWTVRKGFDSQTPAVWFLGSMLLRTCVILAGFWVLSRGHWPRLVACLVGFLVARVVVVRRFSRARPCCQTRSGKETGVATQSR